MTQVNARPWFVAGFLHLGAAAVLGALRASPSRAVDEWAHVLFALAGVLLVAGGIAHGFVAPFLKREPRTAALAHASLALVLAADVLALLAQPLGVVVPLRYALWAYATAFLLLPLHVALVAVAGTPWRGGVALFSKDQPFRRGDLLAATSFATALAGLAAAAVLLAFPPRGLPNVGVAVFILCFALPFLVAFLLFILPRNAKTPLPGFTLHAAGLVLIVFGGIGLALALAFPVGANFRLPAVTLALAHAFTLVAFLRLRFPDPAGAQVRRARPFLRGAFVFSLLAPAVTLLATWSGSVQLDLLILTTYLYVLLVATLAVAATLLGAPILLNAVPRDGRWGAFAAAAAIAGAFLLAPALQHPRAAFPGALVILAAALLLLWGAAPMRRPRREC